MMNRKKNRGTPHGYNDIFDVLINNPELRKSQPNYATEIGFNGAESDMNGFGEGMIPKRTNSAMPKTNIKKARRAFSRKRYETLKQGGAPLSQNEENNYNNHRGIRGESVYDIY